MLCRMAVCMFSLATALTVFLGSAAHAQQAKPNILVIMGDDIGYWNISVYNRGLMGYRTPNIGKEHQLGGRLPRAGTRTLARRGEAAHRDQRDLLGRGLGGDP